MNLVLNLLWFILGGFWMGLAWVLAGVIMIVTIIGIPWAGAAFSIASFSFWPFGRMAVDRRMLTGREDVGTGPLGLLGNIIWFLFAIWRSPSRWRSPSSAFRLHSSISSWRFWRSHRSARKSCRPNFETLRAPAYSIRMIGAGRLPPPASRTATTPSATAR